MNKVIPHFAQKYLPQDKESKAFDISDADSLYIELSALHGQVITGVITRVTSGNVWVDIGMKCEGCIDASEFRDLDELSPGVQVDVWCARCSSDTASVSLSRALAVKSQRWQEIVSAHKEGAAVTGKVLRWEKSRRGFVVSVMGVDAFLPASHVDLDSTDEDLVGCEEKFAIINIEYPEDLARSRVVLSRRPIILNAELGVKEGAIFKGTVVSVNAHGAVVSFKVKEDKSLTGWLSFQRAGDVIEGSEFGLKEGDECEVSVIKVHDSGKIYLTADHAAWEATMARLQPGTIVMGEVRKVRDCGVFIALPEENARVTASTPQGLLRHADMCGIRGYTVREFFTEGKRLEVMVKKALDDKKRIPLTLEGTASNPWSKINLQVGEHITSQVRDVFNNRAFVAVSDCIDGLLRFNHYQNWMIPSVKDTVECTVHSINPEENKLFLLPGHVDLEKQTKVFETLCQGDQVSAKIARVISSGYGAYGLYVICNEHLHGFVPKTSISRGSSLSSYKEGDVIQAVAESKDEKDMFVILSIHASEKRVWRERKAADKLGDKLAEILQ